jgi:Type ISP C-terminal specificity domain/N-6 DNA Methylase
MKVRIAATMTFKEILDQFAESLKVVYSATSASKAQPEDQLKPPVVHLVKHLGELIGQPLIATTESAMPDLQSRPDVAVNLRGLVAGHVELKAPGVGVQTSKFKGHDAKQWKKFQNHPNLVYSDGNEWALYRNGSRIGKVVRLAGDATVDGSAAVDQGNADALELLLRDFVDWEPVVPTSPRGLADALAPLCRLLRDAAFAALQIEGSAMQLLADEWRHYLFADADDRQFADAYAQTVTYALLLARVEGEENLKAGAADRLDERHGLLAQVLRILAQKESRAEVEAPVDLLERIIGAVDPAMMASGPDSDPWLYFYEDFLAAYDPKLRNDRGVYYTPAQVVQAQVALVTELLQDRFGKSLGIVDDGVVLLDPAAGTGTYLLAAIDAGLAQATKQFGPGEASGRASTAALNFHGFEILVGPYAVAHLRVAQKVLGNGGTLPADGVRVYLADTLESPFVPGGGKQTSLTHRKLSEENERARKVKADDRVLVCIGNPPYDRQQIDLGDESTERKGGWVRFGGDGEEPILDAFTKPVRDAGLGGRLNNLYNDYVYFWRWALWKVFEQSGGGGVVSFITASSYLRGPAFAGMRQVFRETFDELWIIDLGGDNLGARKSENVFAIQRPVAIAIGVRSGEPNCDQPAVARYCGAFIEGSRAEKLAQLAEVKSFSDLQWEECFSGWTDPLLPESDGNYSSWPLLTDLFPWQHSGAQFKRTWPIAPDEAVLEARWQKLLSLQGAEQAKSFRETRDRKVDRSYPSITGDERPPAIATLPATTPTPTVERYAFRSLDRQLVLADSRVADFPRPALWAIRGPDQVFLTSLLTGLLGGGLAAVAAAEVPDLHHFRGSYGAKDVIPLWRDAKATDPNVTSGLLETVGGELSTELAPEDLLAYAYAVLAGGYTERFEAELEVPGPRIPLTKDRSLFEAAAKLGKGLIWLHTYGERMTPGGEAFGSIPPGEAKCTKGVPADPDQYPQAFRFDAKENRLHVGDGIFEPVLPEVWDFSVSGLQIVKSWLSYRMQEGAGKKSSPLDTIRPQQWPSSFTEELCRLLWIIEETLELVPQASALVERIVDGEVFSEEELPTPSSEERAAPKLGSDGPEQMSLGGTP